VHACVGPMSSTGVDDGVPSCKLYFFILKKTIVITGLADVYTSVAIWYNSDGLVLPVTAM
jgi:hypothetical protein